MESDLDRIMDWERLAEQAGYRVQALADLLQRTPQALRNYVLKRWKVSTKTWLTDLQMRAARSKLVGRLRHKEIAQHLGFEHANHFSRAFRMAHGVSPKAFLIDEVSNSATRVSKMV